MAKRFALAFSGCVGYFALCIFFVFTLDFPPRKLPSQKPQLVAADLSQGKHWRPRQIRGDQGGQRP